MSHKSRQPSDYTSEAKRFPTAIGLSVVVNLLFLSGAATILRERSVHTSPSGETVYITLERMEERPAERPAVQRSLSSVRSDSPTESVQPLSVAHSPVLAPITESAPPVMPGPEPTPSLSARPGTIPQPRAVPSETRKSAGESLPPPPRVAPPVPRDIAGAEVVGAEGAASNILPDDSVASPSGVGTNPLPAPGVPTVSPEASPTPGPVAPPAGITRSAELAHQELPRLPDALRESGYRSFVRVAVEVLEDGSFTVVIRTSSGNPDIDARVLEALKRWKWKPALENGVAVTSTQLFRFDFDVD